MFKKKKPVEYSAHFRPQDTIPGMRRRARRKIPFNLIFVLMIIGGTWLFTLIAGLPAILWEYDFYGSKHSRRDVGCTYIRIDGTIHKSVPPLNADRCKIITFFRTK